VNPAKPAPTPSPGLSSFFYPLSSLLLLLFQEDIYWHRPEQKVAVSTAAAATNTDTGTPDTANSGSTSLADHNYSGGGGSQQQQGTKEDLFQALRALEKGGSGGLPSQRKSVRYRAP
jgi:hypothetical protein